MKKLDTILKNQIILELKEKYKNAKNENSKKAINDLCKKFFNVDLTKETYNCWIHGYVNAHSNRCSECLKTKIETFKRMDILRITRTKL